MVLKTKFNKKGLSTIVILLLLLLSGIFVFNLVADSMDFSIDNFKIKNELKNFESNVKIIKINGSDFIVQNNFINTLPITSIIINNENCVFNPENIDLGKITIDIGDCTQNLETLISYPVIFETTYGTIIENEILESLP